MGGTTINRFFIFVVSAAFVAVLGAYAYIYSLWQGGSGEKISKAGECSAGNFQVATNPNKILFVSCGGFLD